MINFSVIVIITLDIISSGIVIIITIVISITLLVFFHSKVKVLAI